MSKEILDKRRLQYLVGQRIKELLEEKQMEQQVLAAKCDFEKSTVSRLEAGRTGPTLWTLYKVALALDIDLSTLLLIDKPEESNC